MPELPDVEAYLTALRPLAVGATVRGVRIAGISFLKTYDPPIDALVGRRVEGLRRLGKRLVFAFDAPDGGPTGDEPWFLVIHLMIAGRLRWGPPGAAPPARIGLAALELSVPGEPDAPGGTLLLTEAGTRKRASAHLVRGEAALAEHDRGGIEPLAVDVDGLGETLRRENRTLKRALTDPRLLSGIGNAYSDEILHAARLSPVKRTRQLDDEELARLHTAMQDVLRSWTDRLAAEIPPGGLPAKVTAFRDDFAVHGRYGQPCPACGTPVQRIRYADNETNYCPRCQTAGTLLADRGLSRLLRDDWPRTIDQLEGS